jgi:hypothetical protein
MTKSKSFLELGGLRVVKKALDRRRARRGSEFDPRR